MNVEIGAEAALFPEKESRINGIAVAVQVLYSRLICGIQHTQSHTYKSRTHNKLFDLFILLLPQKKKPVRDTLWYFQNTNGIAGGNLYPSVLMTTPIPCRDRY
jgi:hypothetical protein